MPEGRLRQSRSCNDLAVLEDQITIRHGRHNPTTNRRGRRRLLAIKNQAQSGNDRV